MNFEDLTRGDLWSSSGFLEGEMKKDEIPIEAIQGSVEAPSPRQMIDLEVKTSSSSSSSFHRGDRC